MRLLLAVLLSALCIYPQSISNFAAAGVTVSPGATPAVAGTALYARSIADTGTYAFTVIDALPTSSKPLTVSTNVSAGVAQRLFTIGTVPIFAPTSAGISFTGKNTGWQWNGGILAAIKIKEGFRIMPNVRFLKSSISDSDYQVMAGVLFGWGW